MRSPRLAATQSIDVTSLIQPSCRSSTIPIVNQSFTATAATFTTDFIRPTLANSQRTSPGATAPESPGIPSSPIPQGGLPDVIGTHTFSTVTTFLVDVLIRDDSRHTREQSAPSAAVVLTLGQGVQLTSTGFERTAPGATTAAAQTPDNAVNAALTQPNDDNRVLTLFVAQFEDNPQKPGPGR